MKLVHLYNAEMLGTATFKEVHGYWLVVVAIIHLYLTSNRPVFLFFLLQILDVSYQSCVIHNWRLVSEIIKISNQLLKTCLISQLLSIRIRYDDSAAYKYARTQLSSLCFTALIFFLGVFSPYTLRSQCLWFSLQVSKSLKSIEFFHQTYTNLSDYNAVSVYQYFNPDCFDHLCMYSPTTNFFLQIRI